MSMIEREGVQKGDKIRSKSGLVYRIKRLVKDKDFEGQKLIVLDYNCGLESRPYSVSELNEMGCEWY
jgi:hypothetical protein